MKFLRFLSNLLRARYDNFDYFINKSGHKIIFFFQEPYFKLVGHQLPKVTIFQQLSFKFCVLSESHGGNHVVYINVCVIFFSYITI